MSNGNHVERRLSRGWLVVIAILVAAGAALAVSTMRRKEVPVRVEEAVRGSIATTISTNGKVEALNSFEAHAPGSTSVRKIFVHEGDQVKAGQLLVQLDDFDVRVQAAKAEAALRGAQAEKQGLQTNSAATQAQLAKARTERDAARQNLQALQQLQQRGAASTGEVDAARNRLNVAEAELRALEQRTSPGAAQPDTARVQAQEAEARASLTAAQQMLRDTNIRAPHDGVVYAMPVHDGQFVNPGDLIVAVADLSEVLVRAFVDEPEIGRLAPGEKVRITWDAIPGRTWEGTLTRVPASVTTRGTRNVGEITCKINNSDLKLLPNVNVTVNIVTAEHSNVITVPREAVHTHEAGANEPQHTGSHVFTIVDGKLHRVEVQPGVSNLTRIEILSGLKEGTMVVLGTTGNQVLREGQEVKVAKNQ